MTVYALDEVFVQIGGRDISGYGEGGAIEVRRDSELWENTKCTDGGVVSCKNLDASAMVTLTLRYDSPANQTLQFFAESRASVAFLIEWPNGDYIGAEEARIQKYPDITDGQTTGDRQWQIFLHRSDWQFALGA